MRATWKCVGGSALVLWVVVMTKVASIESSQVTEDGYVYMYLVQSV